LNPANATLVFEDMARIINAADECLLWEIGLLKV
jgi:hypothetical protein